MDEACLKRLGDVKLNGREIKNAFRTGHALAVHSGEEFNASHIEIALQGLQTFEADFEGDGNDSSGAEEPEARGRKRRKRY